MYLFAAASLLVLFCVSIAPVTSDFYQYVNLKKERVTSFGFSNGYSVSERDRRHFKIEADQLREYINNYTSKYYPWFSDKLTHYYAFNEENDHVDCPRFDPLSIYIEAKDDSVGIHVEKLEDVVLAEKNCTDESNNIVFYCPLDLTALVNHTIQATWNSSDFANNPEKMIKVSDLKFGKDKLERNYQKKYNFGSCLNDSATVQFGPDIGFKGAEMEHGDKKKYSLRAEKKQATVTIDYAVSLRGEVAASYTSGKVRSCVIFDIIHLLSESSQPLHIGLRETTVIDFYENPWQSLDDDVSNEALENLPTSTELVQNQFLNKLFPALNVSYDFNLESFNGTS